MHYSKVKKFVSIVVNKDVDIIDIKNSDDYSEYLENARTFVDMEVIESKNVLDENEFDLCKEVIEEYGK